MSIRVVRTETGALTQLFCDQCGERIEKAEAVVVAAGAQMESVGDSAPCAYLHVGPCDLKWRRRVPRSHQPGWDTASVHFTNLLSSLGLAVKLNPLRPSPRRRPK
jgi:hypothetical protein